MAIFSMCLHMVFLPYICAFKSLLIGTPHSEVLGVMISTYELGRDTNQAVTVTSLSKGREYVFEFSLTGA